MEHCFVLDSDGMHYGEPAGSLLSRALHQQKICSQEIISQNVKRYGFEDCWIFFYRCLRGMLKYRVKPYLISSTSCGHHGYGVIKCCWFNILWMWQLNDGSHSCWWRSCTTCWTGSLGNLFKRKCVVHFLSIHVSTMRQCSRRSHVNIYFDSRKLHDIFGP